MIKKGSYFILLLATMGIKIIAVEEKQVELNLNNNSVYSKNGVDIKVQNNNIKVYNFRRDFKQDKLFLKDKFILESYNLSGDVMVEGTSGEISLKNGNSRFDNNFAWLEVGKVTKAEKPNDKIYFGSKEAEFKEKNINLIKAWLSTDTKANQEKSKKKLGYYLEADNVFIELGKQITFKNLNIIVKNKNILPISIPWYRFNLRKDSKIPLFLELGSSDEYGFFISQGLIYESKNGKFQGGISPKISDRIGLLIGRMENWYDFDNLGTSKINISNMAIWKKGKDNKVDISKREDISNDNRWDIEYTHNYEGNKGYFDLGFRSVTYNENLNLKKIIKNFDATKKFNYFENGIFYDRQPLGLIPDMGNYSNFYNLSTKLEKLGDKEDISVKAKVKLTNDEKAYSYIIREDIKKLDYWEEKDNDLFSNLEIKKENEENKLSFYYNYLKDLDPGSSIKDLKSQSEDFGFLFEDKDKKVVLNYDNKKGNRFKKIKFWEKNPNLKNLKDKNKYNLEFDYTPLTKMEYKLDDSRKFGVKFGEYALTTRTSFKVGYENNFLEKELDTKDDPLRKDVFSKSNRLNQYNRYENILYNKKEENKLYTEIYTDLFDFIITSGDRKEIIETREGFNETSKRYENSSEFYGLEISKKNIFLNFIGKIDVFTKIKKEKYKDLKDELNKYETSLTHYLNLDNNLDNKIKISYKDYNYLGDNKNEIRRLVGKSKEIKYEDELNVSLKDIKVYYKNEYSEKKKAYDGNKDKIELRNNLEVLYKGEKKVETYYNLSKRYSNEKLTGKNYNDLNLGDYGIKFFIEKNEIYYKNENIKAKEISLELNSNIGKFNEDISSNIYGYSYNFGNGKINFEYGKAKDKAKFKDKNLLDIDNQNFSVEYLKGKEIEHSYKINYEDYKVNYKDYKSLDYKTEYDTDVIRFKYGFKDKQVSDEDLRRYASREFGKSQKDLTSLDLTKIREIIEKRDRSNFNLGKIINNKVSYNENLNKTLSFYLYLERSKDRYKETNKYFDSLKEFKIAAFYSRKRTGFGYTYSQKSKYDNPKEKIGWKVSEKEHEFSFYKKFGKLSNDWSIKTYIQFFDGSDTKSNKSFLDAVGIELGKEMDYYKWSIAYIRDYSIKTYDYEWKVALQFTLLTFPDKILFGIGGNGGSNKNVSPDFNLLNGIKIKE